MNRKQLIDSLLKNWPAKIICFVIAIFLYLFYQASLIDKKTFVVPLQIHENGIVVHIGNVPTSVVVSIRADENDIKSIFATDMEASIDLSNITKSGNYRLPINVEISDKLKGLDPLEIKLKEETLNVQVEKRVTRYIQVIPSVVGEVSPDFEIQNIEMSPSFIQIEGPDSLVSAIKEISTEKVNVSNAMTNFTVETTYEKISDYIKINDPGICKATVIVVPKIEDVVFEKLPFVVENLDDSLQLEGDFPDYSITLQGPVVKLKKLNLFKKPIKLNLSHITEPGEYDVEVVFPIPLDFKVISKTGDTIKIKVIEKIEQKEDVEEMSPEINLG